VSPRQGLAIGAGGELPVDEAIPRLRAALADRGVAVLTAPPGAGKTTRVPLALLDAIPAGGRIVMLEPRRLAAVSAAHWMARALGGQVGDSIGYAIRFERRASAATRIEVVTEGILTRRLQTDPSLEGVALVIFDEFHERSLNADLALALCLDARRGIREDLALLVMSATLDAGPVAALLGDAPVISAEGRSHQVEVRYLGDDRGASPTERVARAVERALAETDGDILAFLPGAGEIRACQGMLESLSAFREGRIALHPLYADLPFEAQERAILPGPRRKVVLATSIAETSLTIEGVRVVVDSGLARRVEHHPASGMDRLVTVPASRAEAAQRAGRAGRTAPGTCLRLYSRHALEGMAAFALPEIQRADLAALALELALWGARDPETLPWLDPPPRSRLGAARDLLGQLGALDSQGLPTETGRAMARLPLHPRLACLVLRAVQTGDPRLGCELAAVLAGRDVLARPAGGRATHAGACDLEDRVAALHRFRRTGRAEAGTDAAAVRSAARTAEQLERLLHSGSRRPGGTRATNHLDPPLAKGARGGLDDRLGRLLLDAYPDRLARLREAGGDRYLLASGRGARLSPESCVRGRELIVAVEVDAGAQGEAIVHAASSVDAAAVREECAGRIVAERTVAWDERERRVVGVERECLGAVALVERPFTPGDGEALPVLLAVLRARGVTLLPFGAEARQLRARVRLLAALFPGEGWPDLGDGALSAALEAWLAPFLGGVRGERDLERVDVAAGLRSLIPPRLLPRLDRLAPKHLEVPSGRRVALDYLPAEGPVLAVKLQELFGLGETPAVAEGRAPVLLHLLSPAGRPVQVTRDLRGFWDVAYRQVRAELRGRYPKHPWPDDPWNAPPTAKTKRRSPKSQD
jgi:ATP-dependent helicase HrpB